MSNAGSKKTLYTILSWIIILIVIPATVFISWKYADRQYYLTGLAIIICAMIPFFVRFEKRHTQARELVILAVMCAIAVISRAIFIWIPAVKPMTAIIMLTGIAFGAEAGFMTGAISGFVSNFIFGQGSWTPWQMFAFGIAGFLAGLLFNKSRLKPNKLNLCIFGGATVLALVGPLLDTSSLLTETATVSVESAKIVYSAGLPLNVAHAAATVVVMFLLSQPLLEKLKRIKLKYGLIELEE